MGKKEDNLHLVTVHMKKMVEKKGKMEAKEFVFPYQALKYTTTGSREATIKFYREINGARTD